MPAQARSSHKSHRRQGSGCLRETCLLFLRIRTYNPRMKSTLYRVTFLNHGKVYTLYAKAVDSGRLWGFIEVSGLLFDMHEGLVVDPSEERLRNEFGHTQTLHLPIQTVLRVEEVEKKGPSAIRDAGSGESVVTPFPLSAKPR